MCAPPYYDHHTDTVGESARTHLSQKSAAPVSIPPCASNSATHMCGSLISEWWQPLVRDTEQKEVVSE